MKNRLKNRSKCTVSMMLTDRLWLNRGWKLPKMGELKSQDPASGSCAFSEVILQKGQSKQGTRNYYCCALRRTLSLPAPIYLVS